MDKKTLGEFIKVNKGKIITGGLIVTGLIVGGVLLYKTGAANVPAQEGVEILTNVGDGLTEVAGTIGDVAGNI